MQSDPESKMSHIMRFFQRAEFSSHKLWIFTTGQTTKVIDWSKFKPFADGNSNVANKEKFAFDRVESIGDQHFLLFPQSLQKVTC